MKKLNVLIIEDESIISLHMKRALISFGYEVVGVARNATSALKLIENTKVDIALVDISIDGDIDGIQLANIISKTYKIPIIFITAFKDKNTLKRASSIDFSGYILKPFREEELEVLLNLTIIKNNLLEETTKLKITNNYTYCFEKQKLYLHEKAVKFTKKEASLINILVHARGNIITYEDIDTIVWTESIVSDDSRRQLLYRLKNKLPNFPFELIKGVGYKINF